MIVSPKKEKERLHMKDERCINSHHQSTYH